MVLNIIFSFSFWVVGLEAVIMDLLPLVPAAVSMGVGPCKYELYAAHQVYELSGAIHDELINDVAHHSTIM